MDGTGWDRVEELRIENLALSKQVADLLEFVVWLGTYNKKDIVIDLRLQGLVEKLVSAAA